MDEYRKVVGRFGRIPIRRATHARSRSKVARVNHSSEGQAYEALFTLIRYEKIEALGTYHRWLNDLWEMNWMEANAL